MNPEAQKDADEFVNMMQEFIIPEYRERLKVVVQQHVALIFMHGKLAAAKEIEGIFIK